MKSQTDLDILIHKILKHFKTTWESTLESRQVAETFEGSLERISKRCLELLFT